MAEPYPTYIFDHVDRRVARLVSRLRKPNLEAIVRMFGEEAQEVEDSLHSLIVERFLANSVGIQLDVWGLIVGERREGLHDVEYRAMIGARILSNISEGTINQMTAILEIVGRAMPGVTYYPLYPAGMAFAYVTDTPASPDRAARIVSQMTEVAPAGVEVAYIVAATEGYFGFDDDPEAFGFEEGEFARTL